MAKRATPEELAKEAAGYTKEAESLHTAISIRMPNDLLLIIREFARRKEVGYQTLMKRWLDDRVKKEAKIFLYQMIKDREQDGEIEDP